MGASRFHASAAIYRLAESSGFANEVRVPIDLALDQLASRLVNSRPDHLTTYPSVAAQLIADGATKFQEFPSSVVLGGEPASRTLKRVIADDLGAILLDTYGCTEVGMVAIGHGANDTLTVLQDDVIVERVDDPPATQPGYQRIALTGLHNTLFPVIRYLIDDEVRIAEADGSVVTKIHDVTPGADPASVTIAGHDVPARALRGVIDSAITSGSYRIELRTSGIRVTLESTSRDAASVVESGMRALLDQVGAPTYSVEVAFVDSVGSGKAVRRLVRDDSR
jgi:phenylacetate-coenzyme A ligase PaaK-like adenylate-forming protein